jgi:hypothetical protein
MKRLVPAAALLALALAMPGPAWGSWFEAFSGYAYSTGAQLPAGNSPSVEVAGRSATLSWAASEGPTPIDGYEVRRYDAGGAPQPVGGGCSGIVAGLGCTDGAVPPGEWLYSVVPVRARWQGVESAESPVATVAAPSLQLDVATVNALPGVVTGRLEGFVGEQGISYRLDDPQGGQSLLGSPGSVPAGGGTDVSVTLPTGLAQGEHTIYAVGDQGDVASAAVAVALPVTISSSAWSVGDASSGAESDSSDATAFAGDGLSVSTHKLGSSFSSGTYSEFQLNSALEPGLAASSVKFNLDFAATRSGDMACVYLEVRSGGVLIGTHGSSEAPLACTAGGTSFLTNSTALPEVTSTTIANGLTVRVFEENSGKRAIDLDLATVTGSAAGQSFTLYETATSTSGVSIAPWSLAAAADGAVFESASWAKAFSPSRYLSLRFPAYAPAGSSIVAATFTHSYRSAATKGNVCYYLEVYSGGALIGSHGDAASPISCNESTSAWVTDVVPLPEVTTAAQADDLTIRLYVMSSKGKASEHDLAQLGLTYLP